MVSRYSGSNEKVRGSCMEMGKAILPMCTSSVGGRSTMQEMISESKG